MTFFNRGLMAAAALAALGACATAPQEAASTAAPGVYAGKSVLDAAIEAAGGLAALAQVKEIEWTGTATVNAGGKTSVLEVMTVVRPHANWARSTSWAKADGPKKAKTLQAEQGKAWRVDVVTWTPLPEAQAVHENQQFGLYKLMLLAPLKEAGATVTEDPVGADGTRAIKTALPGGPAGELEFDAAAKLVRAGMVVRNPAGGPDIVETVKFSGEIVSNGVKWPKRITIEQNGAPYFDLEIATFEANTTIKPRPLQHTLDDGQTPPQDRPADAG
ncbi:MAG TPA: hypothetical protein PLH23_10335 [Hyphomonadaceae bacterium]|jgi:hypothetical protein|nr:hypothetical protein [Hyphomonadaceae bacterium]HPI48655.1 hypothetical protein [Hyphomonadaceae bacterium]